MIARVLCWALVALVALAVGIVKVVRWATRPRATLDGSAWLQRQIDKHQRDRGEKRHELLTRGLP